MHPVARLRPEFLARASLVALLVIAAYQLPWAWLRFATSEAVLRAVSMMGLDAERVSPELIRVGGGLFRFVTACTFIDVCMGSLPLLWNIEKSWHWNLSWLASVQTLFLGFNVVRLVAAQLLYACGLPWVVADQVIGGLAYFAVWQFIWWQRSWTVTNPIAAAQCP